MGKLLSSPLKENIFQSYLDLDIYSWLKDHRLEDRIIFPGTGYLEIAIALGLFHCQSNQLLLEDIVITSPLYLEDTVRSAKELQVITSRQENTWHWEIYSADNDDWSLHCSGRVSFLDNSIQAKALSQIKHEFDRSIVDVRQHYLSCQQKGIAYGQSFQGIKQLWAKDNQALGLIELPPQINNQGYHFHPALLDASLQILFAALPTALKNNTYIPIGIDKLYLHFFPGDRVWSYLELTATEEKTLVADVWL